MTTTHPDQIQEKQITKQNIKSNISATAKKANLKDKLKKQRKQKNDSLEEKTKKFYEDKRETKTIFSKISEDLMYKLTKDKYHKSSSYQYMTDDMYINRVVQKGDNENNSNKFNNFVDRNNEFFNKKKLRLNEKIQKLSNEANSESYPIPNKKVFDKAELRNAQEFYETQKNFVLQKQQNLEVQRDEALKKSKIEEHGHIPEINQHSRIMVENKKKNLNEKSEEVFSRLHNQKNARNKQQIFEEKHNHNYNNSKDLNVKSLDNNDNSRIDNYLKENKVHKAKSAQRRSLPGTYTKMPKLKGVKRNKAEMQGYSSKLHNDARKWLERNDERVKKQYEKPVEDLQTKKNKVMNIKRFVQAYEIAANKILQAKKNFNQINNNEYLTNKINNYINNTEEIIKNKNNFSEEETNKFDFADYCDLLYILGFANHNYETLKTHFEFFAEEELDLENLNPNKKNNLVDFNNKEKINSKNLKEKLLNENKKQNLVKKQMHKEAKLLKDSWEILLSNRKGSQALSELELIEPKEALLFLCVVQGFLKGDLAKVSDEEANEMPIIKINSLYAEMTKAENKLVKEKYDFESAKKNLHHNAKSVQKNLQMKGFLKNVLADKDLENSDEYKEANKFRRVRSKDSYQKVVKRPSQSNNSEFFYLLFFIFLKFTKFFFNIFIQPNFRCKHT